jgi:hypothetical protein
MKAIVNKPKEKEQKITYPCLMESKQSGLVVLFEADQVGTVVIKATNLDGYLDCWGLAHHSKDWSMKLFTPLKGSVTLSND